MANTYVWCGGYTGSTGFNSGYTSAGGTASGVWYNLTPYVMDPNSPCVGSSDPCCDPTNPACSGLTGGGLTSSIGDIWFTPYYWGNARNWKKQAQATGGGLPSYVATTTLPKGGDNVIFTGNSLINYNGVVVNGYPYSCLWGGMSGDGYLASGSTGWVGGYTAGSGAHTDISFNVLYSFKKNNYLFWGNTGIPRRTGEIGAGGNTAGNFDYTTPLKIRASSFSVQSNASPSYEEIQPLINVNNLASSSSYTNFYFNGMGTTAGQTDQTNGGVVFLQGNWGEIVQSGGSVYANKIEGLAGVGNWLTYGSIVKMSSSSSCAITKFNLSHASAKDKSYVWGMDGGSAELIIGGQTSGTVQDIVIGSFGGASTPPFTSVKTLGTGVKNLVLASCQIDDLSAESNTHITVHPNLTKHDYCIIRDGYIKGNSSLNMANLSNDNWKNFMLGYSPSDNGLRIDDNTVTIKGFVGESLKTGYNEDNQGVTS